MTHRTTYHPTHQQTLDTLRDAGEQSDYWDMLGELAESEEENRFAVQLGYQI